MLMKASVVAGKLSAEYSTNRVGSKFSQARSYEQHYYERLGQATFPYLWTRESIAFPLLFHIFFPDYGVPSS